MKFLIFVAAVIALGIITIKLKRENKERKSALFRDLINSIPEEKKQEPVEAVEKKEEEEPYIAPRSIDNKTVIVPEDNILKEELEILLYMDEKYPDLMSLELFEGAGSIAISLFEERTGIKLTDELKALYMFSNGMDVDRSTLRFENLEIVEREYKQGYCDWSKEGDADDYLLIGSVIGDGEYLCMEKKTGHIFWHDEGNMTDYISVGNILEWIIEFIYDGYLQNGDEKIESFLKKSE
ncbi:MAG: SMI1/KNR4 family protein [Lachnospiraceae bacterium]|nr:SMI1/KNR4 family protein [Lachnospiraceae bacterium]